MYVFSFHVIGAHSTTGCQTGFRPHFHVYFTASYGLDRHRLEEVNFLLKNAETVPYYASVVHRSHAHFFPDCLYLLQSPGSLPYDFTLLDGLPPPSIFLRTPLLAELAGAGFTKSPSSKVSVHVISVSVPYN